MRIRPRNRVFLLEGSGENDGIYTQFSQITLACFNKVSAQTIRKSIAEKGEYVGRGIRVRPFRFHRGSRKTAELPSEMRQAITNRLGTEAAAFERKEQEKIREQTDSFLQDFKEFSVLPDTLERLRSKYPKGFDQAVRKMFSGVEMNQENQW